MADEQIPSELLDDDILKNRALQEQKQKSKRNATLVSILVHILLLIMAAFIVALSLPEKEEVEFVAPPPPRPRLEPRKLEMKVRVNQLTKRSARPKLQPRMMVNAPSDLALPEIKKMNRNKTKIQRTFSTMGTAGLGSGVGGGFGTGMGGGMGGMGLPPSMQDRCSAQGRSARMRKSGGRAASEKAVQSALAWFADNQNADGSFGEQYKVAMTGLALLAFLGHCETPDSPIYGENVEKMLDYLVSMVGKGQNGLTSDTGGHGASYSHGIATYALGEAYIMTGDPQYRDPFLQGVNRIIEGQTDKGGWLYAMSGGGGGGDTSVSGWQIQALKAAYLAGLDEIEKDVESTLDDAADFIKSVYDSDTKQFGYRGPDNKTKNLTGMSTTTLKMWKNGRSKEAQGGIDFLMERTEEDHNWTDGKGDMIYENINLYSMYYDVQAVFAQGGRDWTKFNDWFQDSVVEAQKKDGSWEPTSSGKLHHGGAQSVDGEVYRTAMNTLMLEIYYRYLPVVDM